ncbi:hypothetical protein BJ742DRAFT_774509 [Cladochytrium replicatum]|nr:hypothetical protein BJ742DRAFT_774509 [Cladochytrium replicatum]
MNTIEHRWEDVTYALPPIVNEKFPITQQSVLENLRSLGVRPGMGLMVHTSMKKLGRWISGGPTAVIEALQDIVTSSGFLIMPSYTTENTDPSNWVNPPVPEHWWPVIRETMPAFHRNRSMTFRMGKVAETFRSADQVCRTFHPVLSMAGWPVMREGGHNHVEDILFGAGRRQADVIREGFGVQELVLSAEDGTTMQRFVDRRKLLRAHAGTEDGEALDVEAYDPTQRSFILLLGCDYRNCSALHRSEALAQWKGKDDEPWVKDGASMYPTANSDDFVEIGKAFEMAHGPVKNPITGKPIISTELNLGQLRPDGNRVYVKWGWVGSGLGRLIDAEAIVEFGRKWMEANRGQLIDPSSIAL